MIENLASLLMHRGWMLATAESCTGGMVAARIELGIGYHHFLMTLPDAVPIVCAPGDVAVTNRQAVHGSFANTSPDPRVTINFGFHRRRSVLGVTSGGVHNAVSVYDTERIRKRSEPIAYAIDARARRFPDEPRYVYQPFAGQEDAYRFGDATRAALHDYNLLDLGI